MSHVWLPTNFPHHKCWICYQIWELQSLVWQDQEENLRFSLTVSSIDNQLSQTCADVIDSLLECETWCGSVTRFHFPSRVLFHSFEEDKCLSTKLSQKQFPLGLAKISLKFEFSTRPDEHLQLDVLSYGLKMLLHSFNISVNYSYINYIFCLNSTAPCAKDLNFLSGQDFLLYTRLCIVI